jgi:cyclopropane fatty-acyl-phospholipid synthase-like methyltransferase
MSNPTVRSMLRQATDNLTRRPYSASFFSGQAAGSRRSAEAVVPLVLGLVETGSVVDIGCGVGTWLSVFRAHGVGDVLGIDGHYVRPQQLEIPADRFHAADLTQPLQIDRRFDLAVSLEVAEHLPPESSEQFVASLVGLADLVLFSAAIPRQRGSEHVNERWQSWWAARFGEHGFVPVDCIRRWIWSDPNVEWWYAQNMILYASAGQMAANPSLQREYELMGMGQLSVVHPARHVKWHERLRRLLSSR